jgi:hypothetical protein
VSFEGRINRGVSSSSSSSITKTQPCFAMVPLAAGY